VNPLNPLSHPALGYLALVARSRYHRARSQDLSRGASAVEWVVITAILVTLAFAIGGVIYSAVTNKANQVQNDIGRNVGG
jgi:hypothetical protein